MTTEIIRYKTCACCAGEFPHTLEHFYARSGRLDGTCKGCRKKQAAERWKFNQMVRKSLQAGRTPPRRGRPRKDAAAPPKPPRPRKPRPAPDPARVLPPLPWPILTMWRGPLPAGYGATT